MTGIRAILRFAGAVSCRSGVLIVVDAGLTLAWQEPISALAAARSQAVADEQLERESPRSSAVGRRRRRRARTLVPCASRLAASGHVCKRDAPPAGYADFT